MKLVRDSLVLLVEDDLPLRKLVADCLNRRGFAVFAASCGAEALKLVDSAPLGLFGNLITDIRLPGVDGLEMISQFLNQKVHFGRVVVTSMWIDEEWERLQKLMRRFEDCGGGRRLQWLRKPYGPVDIFDVLK